MDSGSVVGPIPEPVESVDKYAGLLEKIKEMINSAIDEALAEYRYENPAEIYEIINQYFRQVPNAKNQMRPIVTSIINSQFITLHGIFEVQSAASGDGIYNCYEQKLLNAEWADTAGDSKFNNKNSTSIEVLNLDEHNPPGSYVAHLVAGDLISAWLVRDDEGTPRWVGIPVPGLRTCSVKIQAGGVPSNNTGPFTCKILDQDGSEVGSTISVYPRTHLGTNNFNGDVWPDLSANDVIAAYKDWDGKWYINGCIFDDTTTCT